MSNVGMSSEHCQIHLPSDQLTELPNSAFGKLVSRYLTRKFDNVHCTSPANSTARPQIHPHDSETSFLAFPDWSSINFTILRSHSGDRLALAGWTRILIQYRR